MKTPLATTRIQSALYLRCWAYIGFLLVIMVLFYACSGPETSGEGTPNDGSPAEHMLHEEQPAFEEQPLPERTHQEQPSENIPTDSPSPPVAAIPALLPFWTVLIPVRVNDLSASHFLLDTGANKVLLSREMTSRVKGVVLKKLQFGHKSLYDVPFTSYDFTRPSGLLGVELGGILGYLAFGNMVIAIDYQKKAVYPLNQWSDSYYFGDHVGPTKTYPFQLTKSQVPVVSGRFEQINREIKVLLDTGTSSAIVSQSLFQELGAHRDGRKILRGSKAVSSALGETDSPIFRLRSFRIGEMGATQMWASVVPDSFMAQVSASVGENVSAIVGGAYLREFFVVFNYPKTSLHLARYPNNQHIKPEFRMVGIELIKLSGSYQVLSVFTGSDAEAKGIQRKDLLLEIDGQSTSSMSLDAILQILRGDPGTSVSLKLKRETNEYTVTVKREDLLPELK